MPPCARLLLGRQGAHSTNLNPLYGRNTYAYPYLVAKTIGGNDIGFGGLLVGTTLPGELDRAYRTIRSAAPRAESRCPQGVDDAALSASQRRLRGYRGGV